MSNRRNRGRNSKKIKKVALIPIVIALVVVLFFFLFIFLSLFNMGNSKIMKNVYINDVLVGSLTTEEAREKLNNELEETLSNEISLEFGEYKTSFLPAEIQLSYDIPSALEKAYGVGRTGNIITNNIKAIFSNFSKTNIDAPMSYDEDKLEKIINNISAEIPDIVIEPTYYTSDDELVVTRGTDGNKLNEGKTKDVILSAISHNENNVTLPVDKISSKDIDIEKIYSEIYCEPKNASVENNPYKVNIEKKGVDFAISLDEAKKLVANTELDQFYIPLKYTDAEITVSDLGEDIFKNKLSYFSTKYDSTNTNRATNIVLACEKINGTVLEPGEVFSFNKVVGARTAKNGFKEAIIYSDGELDYGIGGGICQVSSTLYNAVLFANLDIVERKNHSMTVSYVPVGQDATVSYGSVDFKFENSRNYPIKISATTNSGIATITVYGVKEEQEYTINFDVDIIEKIDYDTNYEYSSKIPAGQEVVKQTGKYGYKCSTYKVVTFGDKEISRTLLSTDTYKPQKEIIQKHK